MPTHSTGKIGLVLAGGGITGALYELGALRAIDDLLLDRTVNDFDIYVGTSAGAFVSTLLANGESPENLLTAIEGSSKLVEPIQPHHLFGLNYSDLLQWSLGLPNKIFSAWWQYLLHLGDMTLFDLLWSFSSAIPAGLYDTMILERYTRQALDTLGKTNQFQELSKELYIIATELDSGNRVVFGNGERGDVTISMAVAASSALPLLYKPVRIGDSEYVDGSLRGNASLDLAIEHGATLIICINPLVPYMGDVRFNRARKTKQPDYLSQQGIQAVANQALRITSHAGLYYHIKQLRRAHPEVDIILIEPKSANQEIFPENIMRYSARLSAGRLGFESVTVDLAEDYPYYKQLLARHNIPISRRLVIEEIREIQQSGYKIEVIRRVLEARSQNCGKARRDKPICQLNRTLAELELALGNLD